MKKFFLEKLLTPILVAILGVYLLVMKIAGITNIGELVIFKINEVIFKTAVAVVPVGMCIRAAAKSCRSAYINIPAAIVPALLLTVAGQAVEGAAGFAALVYDGYSVSAVNYASWFIKSCLGTETLISLAFWFAYYLALYAFRYFDYKHDLFGKMFFKNPDTEYEYEDEEPDADCDFCDEEDEMPESGSLTDADYRDIDISPFGYCVCRCYIAVWLFLTSVLVVLCLSFDGYSVAEDEFMQFFSLLYFAELVHIFTKISIGSCICPGDSKKHKKRVFIRSTLLFTALITVINILFMYIPELRGMGFFDLLFMPVPCVVTEIMQNPAGVAINMALAAFVYMSVFMIKYYRLIHCLLRTFGNYLIRVFSED